MADKPVTREEKYLAYLTGDYKGELPKPITRKEKYLYELCLKGIGGEISPEEIKAAVNEYLEKNPVKPGATTEQAKQIEQNKTDIASLKEDLSNKITKFYASNQGEAHITDSDNGKIQDMMLYGKSEQNQYKGINLLPADISYLEIIEVSIPKGTHIFWATDGTPALGGNFRFRNEDSTQETWFGVDAGKTAMTSTINIDAKYMDFLISKDQSVKICLGIGDDPVYEPYTGGQPSPSPDYPQEIKNVVNPTIKIYGKNLFDSKKFPIILNRGLDTNTGNIYQSMSGRYCATEKYIPFPYSGKKNSFNASMSLCAYDQDYKFISSVNKNNGQVPSGTMYVRFDIKIEDKDKVQIELSENTTTYEPYHEQTVTLPYTLNAIPVSSGGNVTIDGQQYIADYVDVERGKVVRRVDSSKLDNTQSIIDKNEWLLAEPQEIDLTQEEVQTLKTLATYYPTTNISINSEQLDGYTVFNYPISMKNGWDYVKKQLNDNRDYIYDMDLQSAEAYVNSEYAVALTELEV